MIIGRIANAPAGGRYIFAFFKIMIITTVAKIAATVNGSPSPTQNIILPIAPPAAQPAITRTALMGVFLA